MVSPGPAEVGAQDGSLTLLTAGYVLPGACADALLHDGGVVVGGSRILDVGDAAELQRKWPAATTLTFPGCLLMPGLVNAHQHGRGISQIQLGHRDDYLETWISGRRSRGVLDPGAITRLAAARMLANGVTTTIHANYSYGTGDYAGEVRTQIAAYADVGLRATVCVGAMDRGQLVYPPHEVCFLAGLDPELRAWLGRAAAPAYAGGIEQTIALMADLRAEFGTHPLIRLCYGPAGPQWVSDDLWRAIARDARDHDLGIHLHALESPAQRTAAAELFPGGVFNHLSDLGVMTSRTVVAHGVWVDPAEIEVLAASDATVVHNPGCNLRMRNGIAPLAAYLKGGVRLAVGTDNCALDDEEDLLAELRLAANLARVPEWRGAEPPGSDVLLAMATHNGAVAAQFGAETGMLEAGRRADIAVFSLERTSSPYLDPDVPVVDAFLARANGRDAVMTMVDGTIRYCNGSYPGLSVDALQVQAADAARSARRPADIADIPHAAGYRHALGEHYRQLARARAGDREGS